MKTRIEKMELCILEASKLLKRLGGYSAEEIEDKEYLFENEKTLIKVALALFAKEK